MERSEIAVVNLNLGLADTEEDFTMRDRLLQATILTLLLQVLASMSSPTSIQASITRLQADRTYKPTIIHRLFNLSQLIQTQTQKAEASFRLPE